MEILFPNKNAHKLRTKIRAHGRRRQKGLHSPQTKKPSTPQEIEDFVVGKTHTTLCG
jgi:hypothetical protein